MKKKGFTLIEILLALGIVGVVSALIFPVLNTAVQNKVQQTKIDNIISDLSNAISNILLKEDAKYISETTIWNDNVDINVKTLCQRYIFCSSYDETEHSAVFHNGIKAILTPSVGNADNIDFANNTHGINIHLQKRQNGNGNQYENIVNDSGEDIGLYNIVPAGHIKFGNIN